MPLGTASNAQLGALLDASLALSSTLELDAVLRRIVQIACRVSGARYGALGVLDTHGTRLDRFIFHGLTARQAAEIGNVPRGLGVLGALITDARPLRLDDISADPRSVGFPERHPPMRTFLGVPVTSRGRVFGNLYLTEKRGGEPFTEPDEELVVVLAQHAGVAVENARLYAEQRRRADELESLQEVGAAVLAELEPSGVLRTIASRARTITGAHSAIIATVRRDGDLTIEVAVGRRAKEVRGMRLPSGSLAGRTLASGGPMLVSDVDADPDVHAPAARAIGSRSAMFVPLGDPGTPAGVLGVFHTDTGRFTDEALRLLGSFGNLASLALRNARLFAEERDRRRTEVELAESTVREQMAADLLRQTIRAQEDERGRISRDLHDSMGQTLASILLGLKAAEQARSLPEARERLAGIREMTAAAVSEMRRLALELRPTVLDDVGLDAALERYVRGFAQRTGVDTRLRGAAGGRLDPEIETVVYRIVQESLTNVAKHAAATKVRIAVTRPDGAVRVKVSDDGKGFDTAHPAGGGLGLAGMRERAGLVNGTLSVRSVPGAGTTVTMEVPLP